MFSWRFFTKNRVEHARFGACLLPVLLLLMFSILTSAFAAPALHPQAGFADLVEKLSPTVVNISTTQKIKNDTASAPDTLQPEPIPEFSDRFGTPEARDATSLGSGFIIDASGFIITNDHVIEAAESITVTLPNNDKLPAKIVGRDNKTDLALLKVETPKPLPSVTFGDSDAMRVGDWVIAIGNPYGLGGTVTQGIISARQRSINAGPFDDFLQTDASINRGNSGGPLFNLKGEVIGINTAIFSPSGGSVGIGFAIPSSLAKPTILQLKKFGRAHHGWIGITIQEVSAEMAARLGMKKPMGALILAVTPNGPAAQAGIMAGDIITQFAGKPISEMRLLPRMVAETKIGSTADMTYLRKGKRLHTTVKVSEQEEK